MSPDLEHFADRLVAGMPDAVVYADAEGVIRRWNRGATRIFGFEPSEALGHSLDIIIPEGLRSRHWSGLLRSCAMSRLGSTNCARCARNWRPGQPARDLKGRRHARH
jgi:PAS domain-containing protein